MKKTTGFTAIIILRVKNHKTGGSTRIRLSAFDFDKDAAQFKALKLFREQLDEE